MIYRDSGRLLSQLSEIEDKIKKLEQEAQKHKLQLDAEEVLLESFKRLTKTKL